MLQLLITYKILRIIRSRDSKHPALPCWLWCTLWHGTVGFKPLLRGLILSYKKWNRVNKRERGHLLQLGPILGDVASNALWHMGKPNPDNLHWHMSRASTLPDEHGMPYHLCLLRSSLLLCFTLCHPQHQLNWLISPGFHFRRNRKKDARLVWWSSWNIALIPPADTASGHEKSPAQRVRVFAHTACLFLLHNSSAVQAGQSLHGLVLRMFL